MSKTIADTWNVVRWPLLVLLALYLGLVMFRIPTVLDEEKTQQTVSAIHAQKLTLDDVMGKNAPPPPGLAMRDASIEGVDVNSNGVRDDVELALFAQYATSTRIRAAELQYARALQVEMTDVSNAQTWVAAAQEDDRGFQCIASMFPRTNLEEHLRMVEAHTHEVEELVFNTPLRRDAYKKTFKFTTSFGLQGPDVCDIDLSSLPG